MKWWIVGMMLILAFWAFGNENDIVNQVINWIEPQEENLYTIFGAGILPIFFGMGNLNSIGPKWILAGTWINFDAIFVLNAPTVKSISQTAKRISQLHPEWDEIKIAHETSLALQKPYWFYVGYGLIQPSDRSNALLHVLFGFLFPLSYPQNAFFNLGFTFSLPPDQLLTFPTIGLIMFFPPSSIQKSE